ncbi:MAG: hypothetical protein HYY95_27660 [Candidatus Rokubacteria bacterium]|nr:hypothetical protein [Candidatus Rokubacteria bacterium]MBI3109306.1 hypothetical protein [Candidatus Rokubacteria bacterium]
MPRKRWKPKSRREAFSLGRRAHLLIGHDLLGHGYGREDDFDAEAAGGDWREHREELVTFWGQDPVAWRQANRPGFDAPEPGGPGTRPVAWWWWDAPADERRVLGLAPIDEADRRRMGALYLRDVLLESQATYLQRHALLSPEEERCLPPGAFEPERLYDPELARTLEGAGARCNGETTSSSLNTRRGR